MERGMKWGVRQVSWERLTTEAIKRMKFARGPALPEVSTSAGLISDLHHYHSPVFPSPSSARTCGGRDVTLMSARVLSVDKLPTILWRDKLSRLIISLSLTVRQLIKAPQGSIISSFSSPALSAGGVRPLMGGGHPWDDELSVSRQARSRSEAGANSHSWLSMHQRLSSQNQGEGEGGPSAQARWKNDSESSWNGAAVSADSSAIK